MVARLSYILKQQNEKIPISKGAACMFSGIVCTARSNPIPWHSGGRGKIGDDTKIERERI